MEKPINFIDIERKVFTTNYQDGLWDILIACLPLMFAVAPLLSEHWGDFWSSFVFLPIWGLVTLLIRWLRNSITLPRIGSFRPSAYRRRKLTRFNLASVILLSLSLFFGIVVVINFQLPGNPWGIALGGGLIWLMLFGCAAYFLDFNRLYLYGILMGIAPLVGEWLFQNYQVPHHGYPVTFSVVCAVIFLTGLTLLIQTWRLPVVQFNQAKEQTN